MRRELSGPEVIQAGRAQETLDAWERARDVTWALYGPTAARVTYSQTAFPVDDHHLRTIQVLAFDRNGRLLPYDFAAPWWAGRDLPEYALASAAELAQDDVARGVGGGFPDDLRDELRAFTEERLGVETLHTWADAQESETLTWMFDLTSPPPVPFGTITDDAGAPLARADLIAAGQEREALARWDGAREYVQMLYGTRAVRADVNMFSRYNDNTYDRDIKLDVFDDAGTRLFFDLRLPWWRRFGFSEEEIAAYVAEHDPAQVSDGEYDAAYGGVLDAGASDEITWLATLLLGAEFIETRNFWDTDTVSYDLRRAPALHFPQLWVEEDGG